MKNKLILIGTVTTLAAIAIAVTVDGTAGRGVAANADGVRAGFDVNARKITDGTNVRVGGGGTFLIRNENAAHRVAITFHAERLGVNGINCEFGGPAVRHKLVNGRRVDIRGRAIINTQDNRRENAGDPDKFAIRFDAEGTANDFTFRGTVAEGGLAVFHREQD